MFASQKTRTGWSHLIVSAGALWALALSAAGAAEPEPGRLTLTTQKAVVFKDGYALLIKEAKGVADADGCVFTLQVPDAAVLGSFWAASQNNEILAMRAEYTDDWKRVDTPPGPATQTLDNLLKQVTGKTVTLTADDDESVRGTLLGRTVIEGRPFVLVEPEGREDEAEAPPTPIALSKIAAVRSPALADKGDGNQSFARAKRLSFDLGAESAGRPVALTLMYFAPGIRWIPTYRVTGDLKDTAAMALQAEILNQSKDLRDVALDLVVGVPHFRFRDVVSPMVLEAKLRNALAQAAPQLMGQMSNAMFTQRAGEWRRQAGRPGAPEAAAPGDIQLPPELGATGEQDLYVYNVPKFSLRAGGRATVPLWQAEAPLHHLYTLDLNVVRNARHGSMVRGESDDAKYPAGSPLRLLKTQVWHQLELTNRSKVPWTTGAAIILRDSLPMGQDLLTYTPPRGTSLLPMTVAVNLRGTLKEEEIERKPNVLNWGGHAYSLIRKRGIVTLTSYRDADSDVRVAVSLPGKAEKASSDGKVRIDDFHPGDWQNGGFWQNNHSEVVWDLTLKPGETAEFTYTVSFYVP